MTKEEWNHINDDWLQDEQIKEPEKEPEKKSEDLPEYVVKVLSYVKDRCNECDCVDCIFCDLNWL